jgi:anti-anti-sigma regulatory factor
VHDESFPVITQPSILVGTSDRTVLVRVEGKGSFLNSTGLKEFAREMTNRGFREFVVDLKNCPVMDSTFMGTLAGVALRLRELGQGCLRVINLNERNRDLLGNLGLDQLFTIDLRSATPATPPVTAPQPLRVNGSEDKTARAETMLEAHEACVAANPENAAKFKDVLDYLKQDLHLAH